MKIANVDTTERALIVAEIGNNHEGDMAVAERLVDAAAESGANAVKFQTFRTHAFVSPLDPPERLERMRRFELSAEDFKRLADRARARGLLFMSTPLDMESLEILIPLVDAFKIASGDATFLPLVERIAATGKPTIAATGLASLIEIDRLRTLFRLTNPEGELGLLHCVTAYPTPLEQANLQAIATLSRRYPDCTVGYSDHTIGIQASVLAVAVGARIIEKHFTLANDHSEFRDHQLSATPLDFSRMVAAIREAEIMLGSGDKELQQAEAGNLAPVRRSVVAARDIGTDRILTPADITWMRPGHGVQPGQEGLVLGRRLRVAVAAGTPISVDMIE